LAVFFRQKAPSFYEGFSAKKILDGQKDRN